MKDICELCSLRSPNMGCTKLNGESCLKEALKNVKPSTTNGEVMQTMFPQMKIISANPFSVYVEMKECNQFNNIVSFDVDWWNRKWGE